VLNPRRFVTTKTLLAGTVSDKVDGNGPAFKDVSNEVKALATTNDEGPDENSGTPASTPPNEDTLPEDQLPKRWRGKSFTERVETYKTLESELGRKNNEIGQLRWVIDEMLKLRGSDGASSTSPAKKNTKAEPVTNERLLTDPETTISAVAERAIEEKTAPVNERLDRMEFETRKREFESRFPKYEETMANEEFLGWVKQSPYRGRLVGAAVNGSWEAAHELFGLYEEVEGVRKAKVTGNDPNAAKEGAVTRPGNGNTTGGAQKKTVSSGSKKIYSRSELAKLYMTNRDAYNAMGDEIRQAYRENRVR
jgi:hypothetical protein